MPTFDTPNSQTDWPVPQGVIAVDVRVVGGTGGGGGSNPGGPGGEVTGRIPVTAGEVLSIIVGESGGQPAPGQSPLGDGGAGGAGDNLGYGGGAPSGVIRNGTELAIGAGGGGAASFQGAYSNGGGGGGARGGLGGAGYQDGVAGSDAEGSGVGGDGGFGNGGSGEAGGTIVDAVVEDVTTATSTDAPRVELTSIIPAPTLDALDASTPREITLTYALADTSPDGDVLVERSTDGGSTWTEAGTITDLAATTWTDTGLLDGERYTYRLTRRASGATAQSGTLSATTILPAPTGLTVTDTGDVTIGVEWTATHNTGETRVEYRPTGESAWTTAQTVDHATESATVDGLRNGEAYDLRVAAVTEHTTSYPSLEGV